MDQGRGRLTTGIICIFLVALVWIAFGQTLRHDFVNFDDNDYVYENPNITSGLSFNGIGWAFTHVHAGNWHPATTISHMLDVQFYGLQPWGHYLTNVLLHAAATVLLFLALRELTGVAAPPQRDVQTKKRRAREAGAMPAPSTSNICLCAFVAALFAVHPLRVESVAWVSERKDVLSGVFFMLTLLAYARYVHGLGDSHSFRRYLAVILCFALGLLSKPTLVTLPFVLLLLDYWPLQRWPSAKSKRLNDSTSLGSLLIEKTPLFVLSTASSVATLLAQGKALQKSLQLTFIERAANAVVTYAAYLGQMFYPIHLAVLYPYSKGTLNIAGVVLDLALLVAVTVVFLWWHRKYPFLVVGWLWYVGMLVPMIGLVQVGLQTRADRYTYLPQIGLYIALAWGAAELFKKWRLRPVIPAIATSIVVIALTACTYHQVSFWQNGETLWKHAIDSGSGSYVAYYSLGDFYLKQRQPDAALPEFAKALQIKPDYSDAEMDVGIALMQKGDLDGAITHTERATQIDPNFFEAQYNLGNLLLQRRDADGAISHYQRALQSKPDYAEAHTSLGAALAQKGQLEQAVVEFDQALRLNPDSAEAHNDLANTLASQRKFDQAIPHYIEALRLNPRAPQVHCNLGSTFLQLGRRDEAVAQFSEALRLNPEYTEAKKRLGELGIFSSP
jgi:tetratricopeptide (TPR) repeat protein